MIEAGRKVRVTYRGYFDDGTVFDSTEEHGNQPLEFFVGRQQVIQGFDDAVANMVAGETRIVHIPAEQGYGPYDPNLVEKVPCEQFPNWEKLPVGDYIILQSLMGPMKVFVQKIEDGLVYLDTNSEMAGKDLNFEIQLVEICDDADSWMSEKLNYNESPYIDTDSCGSRYGGCCADTPAGCGSGCSDESSHEGGCDCC